MSTPSWKLQQPKKIYKFEAIFDQQVSIWNQNC